MTSPTLIALENLKQAVVVAEQIQELETKLVSILNGTVATVPSAIKAEVKRSGKKGKRFPEARARMAAAQKARWAKKKA